MSTGWTTAAPPLDGSFRTACIDAYPSWCTGYDSGWRALPFALVAEFQSGSVLCERDGQGPCSIPEGHAVVVPMGVRHRFRYPQGPRTVTRWAHVRFTILEAVDLLTLLELPAVVAPPVSVRLGELCEGLYRSLASSSPAGVLAALAGRKALEVQLLLEILSVAEQKPTSLERLGKLERLGPVLRHIEEHFAGPLRRERLAAEAHLSPGYFDAVFREALGLTPLDYIKQLRIRRAQELLLHTAWPVKRIAALVGYNDPFHFSRQFRGVCGVSPAGYRHGLANSLARRLPEWTAVP